MKGLAESEYVFSLLLNTPVKVQYVQMDDRDACSSGWRTALDLDCKKPIRERTTDTVVLFTRNDDIAVLFCLF